MNIFTVSFFGHRIIKNYSEAEKQLEILVRNLIQKKEYVEFLVGRDSEFDIIASSAIRRAAKKYGCGNSSLTLVLPYMTAEYRDNEESFHDYYDNVEICSEAEEAYFKAAYQVRNRTMVDHSDLVICCIEQNSGGAFQSVQYAVTQNKKVINVVDPNIHILISDL